MAFNYNAAVNITAHYGGEQAVARARRDISGLNGNVAGLVKGLNILAAAWVAKEILQFGKHVIDLGDSMNDLRQKTGIGVQALSDLKAAAEKGGVDFGQLEGSLKKFSQTLAKAGAGSAQAQAGFRALGISVKENDGTLKTSDRLLLEIADKFENLEDGPEKAAVAMAIFGKTGADLIPVLNGGRDAIEGLGIQMSEEFVRQSDAFNDKITTIKNNIVGFAANIAEKVLPHLNKFLDLLGRVRVHAYGVSIVPASPEREPAADPVSTKKTGKIDSSFLSSATEKDSEASSIRKLREELSGLRQERELEALRLELTTSEYEKRKIAIEETTKAEKTSAEFSKKNKDTYMGITQEIIAQKQAMIDLAQQQKETFGAGAQAALKEYAEQIRDVASQTKSLFTNAFRGIEDSLVSFVQTGKLSFADLARQIEAELLRIAIRQAIIKPLTSGISSLFGFADGGIMTSAGPVPLKKYASGGIASSPQLAMFGEGSQPEAYVPLPDGRSIPVSMQGQGGGTSVVVNVTVNNSGSTEEDEQSNSQKGKELGAMISSVVKAEIVNQKRPGGLLAS